MAVLERHSREYTVDCIKQLFTECHIPYNHMINLRVCAIVSWEHPETLDLDPPGTNGIAYNNQPIEEIEAARETTLRIDTGLDIFQLVPKDENGDSKYSGDALLEHMVRIRGLRGTDTKMAPSDYLDLGIHDDQLSIIQPSSEELCRGAIMRDAIGVRAQRKCAQRKMNNLGTLVGHSNIVNSKENIDRMKNELQMASAMAEINAQEADDALKKKQENDKESAELAPASARKLEANGRNIAKCTVKEIYSLLVNIYNINLTGSKLRKPDFVTRLENEITRDTGRYERYIATLNDASASGAAQQEHADDEVEPANDIAVQQADNEEQPVVEEEAV